MTGSGGPGVQAHSTWLSEQLSAFGDLGAGVTDLTVPGVGLGLAPSVYRPCAWPTLRRIRRGGRIAELEFAASGPDAVHDHGELAGHGAVARFISRRLAPETPQNGPSTGTSKGWTPNM